MPDRSDLAKVLHCDSLPSLPTVGVQVLTLTRDPDVNLDQIAKVIETDPALSAKVLRTVNSSMYGLKTPCTTMRRALNFLGLSAVKSIVLGFSLVDSTRSCKGGTGFDISAHWRRSIFTAAAARTIAQRVGGCDPEEAFAAALFQDIGALAMFTALGESYTLAIAGEPDDHFAHTDMERAVLGFDHCEAGAGLANKWRLPDRYVQVIQHHHNPDNADADARQFVRIVSLGMLIGVALLSPAAQTQLPAILGRATLWFNISSSEMAGLFKQIGAAASEIGRLFGKPVGQTPDPAQIMRQANEALVREHLAAMRQADELREKNEQLARAAVTDALTGLGNRKKFDVELARLFDESATLGRPFALAIVDGDKFKSVNDTHGHHVGDAVLKELARRIAESLGHHGLPCRYGGEEFALIMPGSTIDEALAVAEQVRRAIAASEFDVSAAAGKPLTLPVTISIGVSANDPSAGFAFSTSGELISTADKALYQAKHAGRNRVCSEKAPTVAPTASVSPVPVAAPATASAQPKPNVQPPTARPSPASGNRRLLLLEDDPLAAKMFQALLQRIPGLDIEWHKNAKKGIARIDESSGDPATHFHLVVCDLNLAEGNAFDVLQTTRNHPIYQRLPFLIVSANDDQKTMQECLGSGASGFISKDNILQQLPAWVSKSMGKAA